MNSHKSIWIMFGIFSILYLVDFFLTSSYLAKVGSYGEFNPIMKFAVDSFGINSILICKLAVLGLFAYVLKVDQTHRTVLSTILAVLTLTITVIVGLGIYCNVSAA